MSASRIRQHSTQVSVEPARFSAAETGIDDTGKRLGWYRSPIDRAVLAELNRKNDWQPLLHNLGMLGFSAATGALAVWAFHHLAWPWVVAAVWVHCSFYGFFGGGTGGHELAHKSMFKSRWLNEFFLCVNGFLTWFNYIHFRRSHAKHHQYTTHHDLRPGGDAAAQLQVARLALRIHLPPEGRCCWCSRSCSGSASGASRERDSEDRSGSGVLFPASDPEGLKKMVRWARAMLLFGHAALALVFVLSGNWILLFLVTFATFLARWFGILTHVPQHIGMEPDVADWRRSTRTYLAGPFVCFFYWNMNYHVEHHMFAAVPFYNLPKLRKVLEPDLPVAPYGLFATWREIVDTLRKQKRDPTYHRPLVYPDARSATGA